MVGVGEIMTTRGRLGNAVHMTVRGRLANRVGFFEFVVRKIINLYSSVRRVISLESTLRRVNVLKTQ